MQLQERLKEKEREVASLKEVCTIYEVSNPTKLLLSSQDIASAEKSYTEKLKKADENLKAAIQNNEELRVRPADMDLKVIHFVFSC